MNVKNHSDFRAFTHRFVNKEHFMVLMLDTKNKVIKEEIVSIGTLNGALIHPREVFKSAIKESANAIIMVHASGAWCGGSGAIPGRT